MTKVRADKLICKAFSDDSRELGQLRITPIDEDPENIAFNNLQISKQQRTTFKKAVPVIAIDVQSKEKVIYPSLNKATKAFDISLSKLRRLCKTGESEGDYIFQKKE